MPDDHEADAGKANEWDIGPPAERPSVAPEDLGRFRGLVTELLFSATGALIFTGAAICLYNTRKPIYYYYGGPPPPPAPLWETALYQWLPLLLLALAFASLIWLITIPLRMAQLKRSTS